MMGRNRGVRGGASRALVLIALVVVIVLLGTGTALAAPPWTDAPNAWWISTYSVTDTQVGTVGDGYPDGTFRPGLDVNRAQFAKMVVEGMGVPTANPYVYTFKDVPASNYFYPWIEGGAAAGIISGFPDGTFGPKKNIIRQQADSILGNYLAQKELNLRGHIAGHLDNYVSLNTWYLAEGAAILGGFADANRVSTVHAPATAYLVFKGVVEGSNSGGWMYLGPGENLTRAQAAVLILRVQAVTFSTALPTVTLLNPSSGLPAGGNSVVISGTNFTEVTSVRFGATSVTFTANSSTQITTTAPAGTLGSTVDVTVTTAAGTSATSAASKYVYGLPTLTALSPASGPASGGNTVTITGTNLTGASAVKFGVSNANSYSVVSNTQITAVAPSGTAGTLVDVTVTTPGGTTATSAASKYSYGSPTVTLLNPATGPGVGGNSVTITGTGFTGLSGAGAVKFGAKNAASYVVNSPTSITAVAPSGPAGTTVDVTVTSAAGTSSANAASKYSYGGPVVTALNPQVGAATGGTVVIITGTGFTGITSVSFGVKNATSYTVNSATQITAVAPSGTSGTTVDVTVTNASGTSGTSAATKFTYGVPSISDLSPTSGSTLGGTPVTITGTGFMSGATVTFGTGYPATSVVVLNSTTITCVSPAHPAGVINVVVTTTAGSSSTTGMDDDYTYKLPATDPNSIHLTPGSTDPVGAVVDVAIPAGGATDNTGKVLGWVANTACNIRFTVTDAGTAHSTITINGVPYTSGNDYKINSLSSRTIIVTTTETGKATVVRTFVVSVAGPVATAPSAIHLTVGATNPVGGVTDVTDPGPGGINSTGAVTGWVDDTACNIKFTVTDSGAAHSTITINGAAYTSGNDYKIATLSSRTIVVTTSETGKTTVTRTFVVSVTQVKATAPSAVHLLVGTTNPVGGVTDITYSGAEGTNSTGAVTGWVDDTACNIRFTVTDAGGASSTITINGAAYTSGNDYKIPTLSSRTIVVTTTEAGKATVVRTFVVSVAAAPPPKATAPSAVHLLVGTVNPVGGVTDITYSGGEAPNSTGAVTGWVANTACNIRFTVTDAGGASSTITINGADYTSGDELKIGVAATLTIVVTTTEAGKTTVVRTFTVSVSA